MQHIEELHEIAQVAINRIFPGDAGKVIATRGLVIFEALRPDDDAKSVVAVQFGTTTLQPYEVLALMAPIEIQAKAAIHANLIGPEDLP